VTGGKPIAVLLQSITGVSAINPLVAFYDIYGKRERCYSFILSRTPHETSYTFIKLHTYITSRPFPIGVSRDHFLPLATVLTHTFRFLHFHQIPHTHSPVSGTLWYFFHQITHNNIKMDIKQSK
jgi:hypothetical protein